MNMIKHEFALYVLGLSEIVASLKSGSEWFIDNDIVHHRISNVLRLAVGDTVTLFDRECNVHCQVRMMQGKRRIQFLLIAKAHNRVLTPSITCALPLLKRDDFEQALYMLAELGVNTIQLIMTDKSVRSWNKEREGERLERIMVAAAEQSKHFAMPIIKSPIMLDEWSVFVGKKQDIKIYFDVQGKPLLDVMNTVARGVNEYTIMVGPEGDLTEQEKQKVLQAGFMFCRLTPTVLRAVHAVCLGVGAFRSL